LCDERTYALPIIHQTQQALIMEMDQGTTTA
jgi:hypothetical protein